MNVGNVTAVLAFLNAKGGGRGYGRTSSDREVLDRINASGQVHSHQHLHVHFHSTRLANLDDSELDNLIAEHRQALARQPEPEPGELVDVTPDRESLP
jgi:hypothetical protein